MVGNLHIALAVLGAALAVGLIGMKASEAVGRNPGAATPILVQSILSIAFAEAIVFYALFLAFCGMTNDSTESPVYGLRSTVHVFRTGDRTVDRRPESKDDRCTS